MPTLVLLFNSSKVINRILFSVLTISLLSFTMHKYYVSITEANYNAEQKVFEISIKFIGHDLEKALSMAGAPELYLGTPREVEKANDYLMQYIAERFNMLVDGEKLNYNFVGKEVNYDDFIYCFIETSKVDAPKKIEIKNTLLIEIFDEQANTVYLSVGDKKLNYTFNKEKVSDTHTIN